jgi:hypothetical protein
MTKIEASNSYLNVGDDGDLEFEVARVELGDNFVVIPNDLENGDPFLLFFATNHCICVNRPLKTIGETLGIRGILFYEVCGRIRCPTNKYISYRLLIDLG